MSKKHLNISKITEDLNLHGIKKKYLKRTLKLAIRNYCDYILVLGIFGSVARGTADEFSDIDLIIVYSNNIPESIKKKMIREFLYLEKRHNYHLGKKTFENTFLRSVLQLTGMFRSIFFSSEKEWEKKHFRKIFNLGSFINNFAPKKLVLLTVIKDVIWININKKGFDFDKEFRSNYDENIKNIYRNASYWIEWIRGYLTAQVLSIGAFVISLVFNESTKFSIEAVKWSQLSTNLLKIIRISNSDTNTFLKLYTEIDNSINKTSYTNIDLKEYILLRTRYKRDPKLNLLAMIHVWKIFNSLRK